MSTNQYRIGDVLNGKVWAGTGYGFQSRSTFEKLKKEGAFRFGAQELNRVAKAIERRLPQGVKNYAAGVAAEGQRQQAVKDRVLNRAGFRTDKPDATTHAIEATSRVTNIDSRIVGSAAAIAQGVVEGKVGIDALTPLARSGAGRVSQRLQASRSVAPIITPPVTRQAAGVGVPNRIQRAIANKVDNAPDAGRVQVGRPGDLSTAATPGGHRPKGSGAATLPPQVKPQPVQRRFDLADMEIGDIQRELNKIENPSSRVKGLLREIDMGMGVNDLSLGDREVIDQLLNNRPSKLPKPQVTPQQKGAKTRAQRNQVREVTEADPFKGQYLPQRGRGAVRDWTLPGQQPLERTPDAIPGESYLTPEARHSRIQRGLDARAKAQVEKFQPPKGESIEGDIDWEQHRLDWALSRAERPINPIRSQRKQFRGEQIPTDVEPLPRRLNKPIKGSPVSKREQRIHDKLQEHLNETNRRKVGRTGTEDIVGRDPRWDSNKVGKKDARLNMVEDLERNTSESRIKNATRRRMTKESMGRAAPEDTLITDPRRRNELNADVSSRVHVEDSPEFHRLDTDARKVLAEQYGIDTTNTEFPDTGLIGYSKEERFAQVIGVDTPWETELYRKLSEENQARRGRLRDAFDKESKKNPRHYGAADQRLKESKARVKQRIAEKKGRGAKRTRQYEEVYEEALPLDLEAAKESLTKWRKENGYAPPTKQEIRNRAFRQRTAEYERIYGRYDEARLDSTLTPKTDNRAGKESIRRQFRDARRRRGVMDANQALRDRADGKAVEMTMTGDTRYRNHPSTKTDRIGRLLRDRKATKADKDVQRLNKAMRGRGAMPVGGVSPSQSVRRHIEPSRPDTRHRSTPAKPTILDQVRAERPAPKKGGRISKRIHDAKYKPEVQARKESRLKRFISKRKEERARGVRP